MSEIKSPLKAIRANCLECCGTANEVKLCTITKCALYPYRLGHNPNRKKKEMTAEQKQAASERMKKAREAKNT